MLKSKLHALAAEASEALDDLQNRDETNAAPLGVSLRRSVRGVRFFLSKIILSIGQHCKRFL